MSSLNATRDRAILVGSIGLLSVAAWLTLWVSAPGSHGGAHHHHPGASDPASGMLMVLFVAGWTVMTLAMMLPTSLPLLATFHTIAGERRNRPLLVVLVVLGYLAIWMAVGVIVYGGRTAVQLIGAASPWWETHAYTGGALILLLAGAYQFTPLKRRCLDKCRSPLSFVLGYWQGEHDRRNAFRLGVHHGLFCVGCCWALMLLMFVVGINSLLGMLVLGAIMAVEKNVPWGQRLSAPLGILLLSGGLIRLVVA
jgi:predicted metal-binding membrane protein